MALEPLAEMVGAAMGRDFLQVCERIHPESVALYREVLLPMPPGGLDNIILSMSR